ncbi:MAG: ribosomal protein S12 methylthiotransferase RimO [Chloroflexi bacterium RBG_16_56_11]|nr:MAG: ribosomal protein S12 methylthiotransferase RimO [Chloroflexi bacterium RBG_16_56_11]
MSKKTFHIVSLGCSKNTVDSDSMAQLLTASGYEPVADPRRAHVLIVNTCGFIGPAKEESLRVLAELAAEKKSGQMLVAAGCLTQRYGSEIARQVPGLDGNLGTRRWMDIVDVVEGLNSDRRALQYKIPEAAPVLTDGGVRRVSVQGASAYLKIADGCRRPCAFCAIPLIKGTAVSRPIASILDEARYLQEKGVREIVLVAQDTTDYGHDLGLKNGLACLLKELTAVAPQIDWIRLMYAYPGAVTDKLIEVMASCKQVVAYLDLPLQHAHPLTLRRMCRPSDIDRVRRTLAGMRRAIPDLALRTTFIVGYPGETAEEFQTLLDFIGEVCFDRVGVFKFSFEQGTASESLGDPVPEEIKEERLQRLMEKQQGISLERNRAFIGRRLDVLIEGEGQGISIGRSYRDAPEIDGLVLVKGEIPAGRMVPVRIDGASAYDLSGVANNGD